ncbi:MAG: hypothetical protein U0353_13195 [Sandaracinus sp.]
MTTTRVLLCVSLAAVGCGGREPAGATPSVAPAAGASSVAPEPTAEATADERGALRRAEDFVRAQGYLDTPPSVAPEAIVHEGIEGTIDDRQGTLVLPAVAATRGADGWQVTFAYRDPQYAGRGRLLILPDQGTPHFVHQDLLLTH